MMLTWRHYGDLFCMAEMFLSQMFAQSILRLKHCYSFPPALPLSPVPPTESEKILSVSNTLSKSFFAVCPPLVECLFCCLVRGG